MNKNTEIYKHIILPIIKKYAPHAKIILYGSRARNDAREGSDIDIALDMGEKINDIVMSMIHGDLEESNLPICFDVIDFQAVSERMQKEILKDGVIWQK